MPKAHQVSAAVLLLIGLLGCSGSPNVPDGGSDGGSDARRSCNAADPDAGSPTDAGWDDRLGPWLRQLRVQSAGAASPSPVAWSMINLACQNRSLLLQLGLLLAKDPTKAPLVIKEADLTAGFLNGALADPALEVGSLNVTGPLMVDQSLFVPGAAACTMRPWPWYWAYHHVPAVKINGQWMAFDLSVSDRPIAIDAWLRAVVAPPVVCQLVNQATYQDVWTYWNIVLGSAWDPPAQRPVPECAYNVTTALTFREGAASDSQFAALRDALSTMEVQSAGFRTLMTQASLPSLTDAQLAEVTSRYEPMTEKTFCARPEFEAKYCATVK